MQSAELLLEPPRMWREGDLILIEVQTMGKTVVRAYKMDVAIATHVAFGKLVREFFEEQGKVVPLELGERH